VTPLLTDGLQIRCDLQTSDHVANFGRAYPIVSKMVEEDHVAGCLPETYKVLLNRILQ
jgi:hypothetical protein